MNVFRPVSRVARIAIRAFAPAAMLFAAGAARAASDPPVTVEPVRVMELISQLELSGTVTPRRVSLLSAELPGSVSAVRHDAGAKVEAGEILVQLDPKLEEIAREQTVAEIADAEVQLRDAHRRLAIAEDLATRSHGPQNAVDTIKTEVAVRNATIARLHAQRAASDERLLRHTVTAPYSGVISRKLTEVGQWVVPGTAVVELIEMEGLRIELPIPQEYFAQVRDGVKIALAFDAMPDADFPARIDAIIPVSDPSARTFTLRVVPVNERIAIAPGMSARAKLSLATGSEGLVVSRDALLRQPDGRITVWVVEPNGEANVVRERRVEVGVSFDGLTEIRSGLKRGDRVVVRGNESLSEGQSVKLAS
jgi:membrane fusion protein (multidrug efflux system)